ncbi:MAG: GGDEF domain-containing protein [Lachnospiraceae bacterium]|nr:GGDEF domain-containing protein [Lachnospiraceae bacterium]
MRRKNIALITAQPEASHELRIIKGISTQCRKYGYHVSVFTPMTHLEFQRDAYVKAESNIFRLVNFDRIDGLILDSVNLVPGDRSRFIDEILERLRDYPDLPVVSLEMFIEGLPMIRSNNEDALREMCRHAIEVHGKRELLVMTGGRGNEVAESRLKICLDEIEKHGLRVKDEHIVYGDFWYASGDELARKIADKTVSLPEAVLCTSTHMALGLIYRLRKLGIRIPEDVIVLGFDTTVEGCCNDVILSAYDAADASSAAGTVDYIRRIIDPGKEILPYEEDVKKMFFPGMSCGCTPRIEQTLNAFQRVAYLIAYNSSSDNESFEISFGRMMESYCMEEFTASRSPEECFRKMADMSYLLKPFRDYQLCLRKDWIEESDVPKGYPPEMTVFLTAWVTPDYLCKADCTPLTFETEKMTPLFEDETIEPSIFYFSPIHFEGINFGYSVLRRSLEDPPTLTLTYRTWLRFVNNALEMTRTRKQLLSLSIRDSMTGLYNRRGMQLQLEKAGLRERSGERLFAAVVDMDRLKKINDTYGHTEGDYGIMITAEAVRQSALPEEICVRAGGDEFYIIGIGLYDPDDFPARKERFRKLLQELHAKSGKSFPISASIGFSCEVIGEDTNPDTVINRADKEMYEEKVRSRAERMDP